VNTETSTIQHPIHRPTIGATPRTTAGVAQGRLTLGWLWIAVYALIAAGLMSLLLALSRTPLVQNLLDNPALFKVALVVHVDLSALIWFFACTGLMWSLLAPGATSAWDRIALALMAAGTLMISAAPFVGVPLPIMNNYVPVLEHPWFFAGLLAVGAGLAVQAVCYLVAFRPALADRHYATIDLARLAMALIAGIVLVALFCTIVAWARMPQGLAGEVYYELLFWGGGHILQIAWTVLLLVAWTVLVNGSSGEAGLAGRHLRVLLVLAALPSVAAPLLYLFPLDSREHILGFTSLMRWGGLAALPLGLLAFVALLCRGTSLPDGRCLRGAALCSRGLYAAGGLAGSMIRGSNTMIPAHYHGAIVAVTLGLMGLVYFVLPRLGRRITMPRAAHWQPYVYAAGQLLHITGLAWSGGYGVQRKVAGAAQGLEGVAEFVGMGLMGLGGLVSVVGGVLFLVIVIATLTAYPAARRGGRSAGELQVFMRS